MLLVTLEYIAEDFGILDEGPVLMKEARDGGAESDPQYSRKKKYN